MSPAPRDYDAIASAVKPLASDDDRTRVMTAVSDALWEGLRGHGVSWVGFYLDVPDATPQTRLVLGPHRDTPACSPIGLHGVCGQALAAGANRIVHDVETLGASYIACDPRDRSEIVIVLRDERAVWGVLDLDSHEVGAFDARDEAGLTAVLAAAGLHRPAAAPAPSG
jgi:putative methionine-R-sulfoxide reductase with GAF domain